MDTLRPRHSWYELELVRFGGLAKGVLASLGEMRFRSSESSAVFWRKQTCTPRLLCPNIVGDTVSRKATQPQEVLLPGVAA